LAIGTDEAGFRINVNPTDALQTAKEIVAYAKAEGFDMIVG